MEQFIRLCNKIVVSAETVNTFKRRLDKFLSDQDVLYNYKADLHGIRNRSIGITFYVSVIRYSVIISRIQRLLRPASVFSM